MTDKKYRREQYFVLPGFQLRYIGSVLIFMFVIAFISGYTVYYTTWMTLGEVLAGVYPQGRLTAILNQSNFVLFLRIIFITPLVCLISLLLSHRIAGPIFKIKRFLDSLPQAGLAGRIYLRKDDSLKEVAESINSMLIRLESQKTRRREELAKARDRVAAVKDELGKPNPSHGALREAVCHISEELALLAE